MDALWPLNIRNGQVQVGSLIVAWIGFLVADFQIRYGLRPEKRKINGQEQCGKN